MYYSSDLSDIMQTPDKFIQRRVRVTSLDVHPIEQAIVVTFELESSLLGHLGDTMLEETKECQKIIRIGQLNEFSDISALAKEILERFDVIPYSKIEEIEIILSYLKKRNSQGDKNKDGMFDGSYTNKLDEYIELLYGDTDEKIRGSSMALRFARVPSNLELLASNETFLGAICRVLREDGKSSIDLSYNIVHILYCFSIYSVFHPIIIEQKIGRVCMELIEHELNRKDLHNETLAKKKSLTELDKTNVTAQKDYEKIVLKYQNFSKKQEKLLIVSFSLLLNLSEIAKVETRMVSKGIISLLIQSLDIENAELLTLVAIFLKKLSIYVENKNDMAKLDIVDKLIPILSKFDNTNLINVTLKLLLNISFDLDLRIAMVKQGVLGKLFEFLAIEEHRRSVLYLLYHISMIDKFKSLFTNTICIPTIMKLILEYHAEKVPIELISLGINLATNKKNAQVMCKDNGLKMLMRRVFRFKDPLLMKMIRNISQHDGPIKELFLDHVNSLGCSLNECDEEENEEFVVECMGVLGNLNIPNLNFEKLFRKYSMATWLKVRLNIYCEDELLCNILAFLGTAFADEGAASLMLEEGLINNIMDLLNAKQEDDGMVLQIVYLFQQLLRHPKLCKKIISETHIPAYLVDLVHDKNEEIRRICDLALDIIAEEDEEWAKKIQVEKFCWHNADWIKVIHKQNESFHDDEDWTLDDAYGDDFYDHINLIYSFGDQEDFLSEDESPDSDTSKPLSRCTFDHMALQSPLSMHNIQ